MRGSEMKTAVLGAGKMGVWFAKFCKEKGDLVVLASRNKEKLKRIGKELEVDIADFNGAVKEADRILICVSISAFEEIVKQIGPNIRDSQKVMDICSIKDFPVRVMHENIKRGIVLGTHPLFGPGSKGVRNRTFILTPTNSKEEAYSQEYRIWLEKEGSNVFVMSPQKHDELITVILGFPHFLGLAAYETLLDQQIFPETKKMSGTTYRMLYTLAEATTLESPDLFANLQTRLPGVKKIEELFLAKAQEWLDLVKKNDFKAISEKMSQLKNNLKMSNSDFEKSYEIMYKMLEASEK
jgi:prephenate dehydrogenase